MHGARRERARSHGDHHDHGGMTRGETDRRVKRRESAPSSELLPFSYIIGFEVGIVRARFPPSSISPGPPLVIRRALRRACGSESSCGSAWFGSVWGGILGWDCSEDCARGIFPPRESALPDLLNY